MNKKLTFGAIVLVVVMFAVWQVSKVMTSAEPLTAEEATNKVQELYKGEVVEVTEGKGLYLITIKLDTGTYEIEIDRETGDIGNMTRTKQELVNKEPTKDQPADHSQEGMKEEPPKSEQEETDDSTVNDGEANAPHEAPKPTPVEPKQPEPPKQITEAQAISIALGQLNGEVDDVEIGSSGGVTYYLVDIERENDEEEGTVQIHAITGEVMSIIWDD